MLYNFDDEPYFDTFKQGDLESWDEDDWPEDEGEQYPAYSEDERAYQESWDEVPDA